MEYDSGCDYDSLTIYDGVSSSSHELAKLCGESLPKDIASSSNTLHLRFISDFSVIDDGFVINYSETTKYESK